MKSILKKNQVIITALAIMIVIAGYLSFTKDSSKKDKQIQQVDNQMNDENQQYVDVDGNFDLVQNIDDSEDDMEDNDIINTDTNIDENDDTKNTDVLDENNNSDDNKELGSNNDLLHTSVDVTDTGELLVNNDDGDIPGEAVLVNSTIDSGYFFSSKLSREQSRAQLKNSYEDIINNANVSEKDKDKASKNLLRMLNNAEKENSAEILLSAKGFDGVVVSITNDAVDVIINTSAKVTEQQKAIIEDVIKRKTEAKVENIVITPVVVHE
ncbi:MAG TPA: SpoIIIAH-like family protein [Clostridiales bacterium]|nr:SpoIIIAH-like family protein [Clostridiales bacterium]